ncbi:MAG: cystathionine gamma-synthase [Bacillati bacterium ANGP1]|uniref:Cystathionine gamma-synthase n=1 Tax=Candidatus Segetimicrobium genomatis TaxID=2569760 RepID=A0A537IND9_9BACT|nr:MAG: cystathionine gamma-synthase [Terrabacteria group bacterium ANGP1]
MTRKRFETRAIHDGQDPDPATGAVMTPIYQTSTYAQPEPAVHKGYDYSRTANPTRTALETCLASLEDATYGLAFASGMAAITTIAYLLNPGDRVLGPDDVYGGTYRLFVRVLQRYGIQPAFVDMTDLTRVEAAMAARPRMVVIETPTNPFLKILDIARIAELAHAHDALVVVDNTFASPYFQQPLGLGADLVVHSTTKYLGGHSDVVGGGVVTSSKELYETLKFHQNAAGAVPGPFDCWLVLRGIKTLAVRMERHASNALQVAQFLRGHPAVARVLYPGLPDHPGHHLAGRQMKGFGGMVSVVLKGGGQAARAAASATRVFVLAESLGGVESLLDHPASMTHASLAGSPLQVDEGLLRLSVGIEHVQDLIDDLAQALEKAK